MALVGLELVVAMLGVMSWRSAWPNMPSPSLPKAVGVAGLLLVISAVQGGVPVAMMAFKTVLFAACLAYAMWHPEAARGWLVGGTCLQLMLAVAAGTFGTKLASLPILLFAALWATRTGAAPADIAAVLWLALVGEALQSAWLGSRGGAFVVATTAVLWLLPPRMAARGLALVAAVLPCLYPVALTLVLVSLFTGFDVVEPTASNVERSMLSAWCLERVPEFLMPGPGGSVYEADTVDLSEALAGRSLDAFLDPHSFLLSAWIWLGTLPVIALHVLWARTWWSATVSPQRAFDVASRSYFALGALAVVAYTLTPPDTLTRLTVALETGIVLAGISGASARSHPRLPFTGPSEAHETTLASVAA